MQRLLVGAAIATLIAGPAHALDIVIEGWRSHAEFQEIRQKIEDGLPDGVFLVERELTRGRSVFAVQPEFSIDEIRKLLPMLEFEKGKLTILDSSGSIVTARFERKPSYGGRVQ